MESLNVVPSSRLAVVWSVVSGELARPMACDTVDGKCHVVDVGGGTGGFAVPLAKAGHEVTVVDPSPNALAGLTRRAADAGVADRITAVQ
ncbi:MAG: methyltransferase domain-containing protein, partial [Stackebrandtia sp.]